MPIVPLWKEQRMKVGLSVAEAAKQIGMTRDGLSKIERGLTFVGGPTLEKACQLYQCQPGDLYRVENETAGV